MAIPFWRPIVGLGLCLGLWLGVAPASGAQQDPAAATLSVGAQTVTVLSGGVAHPASSGETLHEGDAVQTDANGGGTLTFFDGTQVELEAGTQLVVRELGQAEQGGGIIELLTTVGETISTVIPQVNGARFEMYAPNSYGVVRGTVFRVRVTRDAGGAVQAETYMTDKGQVEVHAGERVVLVDAGQQLQLTPPSGATAGQAAASSDDTPVSEYGQGAGVQRARSLPRTGGGPPGDALPPWFVGAGAAGLGGVFGLLSMTRRRRRGRAGRSLQRSRGPDANTRNPLRHSNAPRESGRRKAPRTP